MDDLLDVAQLLARQAPAPAEVEPQVAGPVVRAGLQRGGAEHLAQRGVHDVGAGVRLACAEAPLGVDLGLDGLVERELALEHPDLVDDEAAHRALDVEHLGLPYRRAAIPGDGAGVGVLAAGLGVERRAVEHDLADGAGGEHRRGGTLGEQPQHAGLGRQRRVGLPVGGSVGVERRPVDAGVGVMALLGLGVGLGPRPLLGHQRAEARPRRR